ncbi:MAG: hypothetical protein J5715_06890 [Clostridiales bacterium]|nr:hypothetical protein [Clostridiales bacterium]
MADYILAFIIPVTIGVLALGILMLTGHRSYPDLKTLIASVLIQSAGYEAATLLIRSFANLYLWESNSIPLAALISVSAVTTLAVTLSVISKDNKTCRLLKIAGYSAFVILMAECLIFNLKSFSANKDHLIAKDVPLTGIASLEEDLKDRFIITGDGIVVYGNTYLGYNDLPGSVRYVSVYQQRQEAPGNRPFRIIIDIKDSSMSDSYMTVGAKRVTGYYGRTDFAVKPAESGFKLGINIDPAKNENFAYDTATIEAGNNTAPLVITSVDLWDSAPYDFMFSRVIILWLITAVAAAVLILKLHKIRYDREKTSHRIIIELVVLATCAATFTVQGSDMNIIEYPLTEPVDYYDVYVQTFDAFEKGQLNIDWDPPAELAELENPYDYSERISAGIDDYLWDRIYFNGKYYSYFGAAPIFTNYYPIYLVTGSVPSCDTVIAINGALASLFLALALLAVIRIYCPNARFLLVILSIVCANALSYIPFLIGWGNMYNVSTISAIMFLCLSLWSGFTATVTDSKAKYFLYLLSGLSLGLCAGSRPTIAIIAAVLIPRFIAVISDKKDKILYRAAKAISFLLPLLAIVSLILCYNYARFGNPLDFGIKYQLTGFDMRYVKLSPSEIPMSFYYYFLIPPQQTEIFPYFDFSSNIAGNAEAYHYTILNLGLLSFPYILLAYILFIPSLVNKKPSDLNAISGLEYKTLLLISFLTPVIIAWIEYCMAGACFKYAADLTVSILVACVLVLTQCPEKSRMQHALIIISGIVSAAVLWLLIVYSDGGSWIAEGDNFRNNIPYAVEYVEKLLVFWH